MPDLAFPLSSSPGRLPGEHQGRHVNGLTEKRGDQVIRRRVPGLLTVVDTAQSGPRGMIDVNGTLYVAYSGCVVTVSPTNVVAVLPGALPGTDGVTFARNNKTTGGISTPDVVACRETGGAYLVSGGAVAAYPDPNLPSTANSVSFLGGYFAFTIADGRIFTTGLNTTAVNALSYTTAESRSDGLLCGIVKNGRFEAYGAETIETYSNEGNEPFPFARYPTVTEVGLLAAGAIAGAGEGWDRSVFFVARDGTVRERSGFDATVVSTPDVAKFIADSDVATLEASVFTTEGRAIWSLSSDKGTWAYDLTTQLWHERLSVGGDRWRASRSVKSRDRWVFGDRQSGKILAVDDDTRTEAGQPLAWVVESIPLKEFPIQAAYSAVFGDFTLGLGDGATPDPVVEIEWSRDGGHTWRGPIARRLGPAGQAVRPIRVGPLGRASHHGLIVRFTISDPVDFSFMGAAVPKPDLRAP